MDPMKEFIVSRHAIIWRGQMKNRYIEKEADTYAYKQKQVGQQA